MKPALRSARRVRWVGWVAAALVLAGVVTAPGAAMPARPVAAPTPVPFEIFFNDEDESPGSLYRYRPGTGIVDTVYTRPSGRLSSFSLYYWPYKLYFVSGTDGRIYRVDKVNGQWQAEQVIFTHGTYVRDLAFLEDGGQTLLYFSQASGAGGDGRILALEYGKAVERYRVRLNQVHGFWAGNFAFDAAGILHLSSGNTSEARIYRVTGGVPKQIYQAPSGSIMGFTHVGGAVYYGDNHQRIWRVRLSDGHRTLIHDSPTHTQITDVQTRGQEPAFPTETPTLTATPSPTSTASPTTTPSPTASPTTTPSPTATSTATGTPTTVPTATRTVSPTSVPSSTATPTATVLPTVSATPADGGGLTGVVSLDGRSEHSGVAVVVNGATAATTDGTGRYEVRGLPPGSYTVELQHAGYLSSGGRLFPVEAGASTRLPSAVLLGGDADGDGQIDIVDAAILTASFDTSAGQPGFDIRADINGDGTIDIFDLVMVGANFGCRLSDETGRCRRWLDR